MKSGRNTFFSSFTSSSFSWNWTELWVIFRHLIPCKTEAITYIERVTGSRHTTFLIEKHKRRRRMVPRRRKRRKEERGEDKKIEGGGRKKDGKSSFLSWWRQMMYCFIQERWKKIEHCTSHERTVTSFPSYFSFERTWIEGWRKKKWISRRREEGKREEKKFSSSAFFSVELNNDRNVRKEILFLPQEEWKKNGGERK